MASAVPNSFKTQSFTGSGHDFTVTTGDVFKIALYTSSATLGSATTAYSATNEVSGTGYTAGGAALTQVTPVISGTTLIWDFADVSWTTATFTARYALIYNTSQSNAAVLVIDFGGDEAVTAGDFDIVWPTADSANAILRLA